MVLNYVNPTYCIPFANGRCSFGATCSLRHNIFKCSCGLILPLLNQKAHVEGKRHRIALATLSNPLKPKKRRNLAGKTNNGAQSTGGNPDERPQSGSAASTQQNMKCEHCKKSVEHAKYDAHVEMHIRQQRRAELETVLDATAEDKEGVIVSARNGVDFGILDPESTTQVLISIESSTAQVCLKACKMRLSNEQGVKFSAFLRGKSPIIQKGMRRTVSISMAQIASFPGHFENTLELVFLSVDSGTKFIITRSVEGTIGSQEDHELLRARAPYEKRKIHKFNPSGPIVPSNRPPVWTKTRWAQRLLDFHIPSRVVLAAATPNNGALAAARRLMPGQLDIDTYGHWFQTLLYFEEDRVKSDLDAYSLTDVELKADYPRYKLLVEGLAEGRPSVLVGDFILVSHTESAETLNTRTWFEGRVHQVHENHVSLYFGDNFSTYRGTKFDVRFVLNRLPYRRMHQNLIDKHNPARLLFPDIIHLQGASRVALEKIVEIRPFYRPLREDEEQMETVAAIINQKPGSVPFVVFGPPGTGKTVTIVEAMRQLIDQDPNVRILACAPNNSAADNIARKLLDLGPTQVFRLNALSRKVDEVSKNLQDISNINSNRIFSMPDVDQLSKCRVVVSTCLSGGVPSGLGLKKGHFTHIFIDEAGQGKEPEVILPIKSNAGPNTNVILAGDNRQLGPVINSPLASTLGLKLSYLDRIMQRNIYDLGTGKGITIVKLIKNFRSHPDILKFSNDQFYNSELQTCGEQAITHSLQNYEELPKPFFPVIFHGIIGKDEREASSPSFFNIDEASQIKKYCVSLIENRKNRTKPEHIGVITPYHAQRCKILDLIRRDPRLHGITVGSVEEFQGQERRVIIISTVRSNKDYVWSDIKRSLGFVANPQRLNVALTRAQALLIVIGNPMVLSLDHVWRGFLNYVHERGGWRGKKIDWDHTEPVSQTAEYASERQRREDNELEETIARLNAMIVSKPGDDGFELDFEDEEGAGAFERPILREAE